MEVEKRPTSDGITEACLVAGCKGVDTKATEPKNAEEDGLPMMADELDKD